MKSPSDAFFTFALAAFTVGCAPEPRPIATPPAVQPFDVRIAKEIHGHFLAISINASGDEITALAKEMAAAGIIAPIEGGITYDIWADRTNHPKVIRYITSHAQYRDKALAYYAIPE